MRVRVHVAPAPESSPRRRADREPGHVAQLTRSAIEEPVTPLPDALLEEMEARFGRNLDSVEVHAGPRADAAARALDARAFTVGRHLMFAAGAFQPGSFEGRRLLAHELAHALQSGLAEAPEPATASEWKEPGVDLSGSAARTGGVATIHEPGLDPTRPRASDLAEESARRAAALATGHRDVPPGELADRPGAPQIHRWPMAMPVRDSAAPLANPLVETIAMDMAAVLEHEPEDEGHRVRRRLSRLGDGIRAAVVGRVQELLPQTRRERAATALTGAAVGEAGGVDSVPSEALERRAADDRRTELRRADGQEAKRRAEDDRGQADPGVEHQDRAADATVEAEVPAVARAVEAPGTVEAPDAVEGTAAGQAAGTEPARVVEGTAVAVTPQAGLEPVTGAATESVESADEVASAVAPGRPEHGSAAAANPGGAAGASAPPGADLGPVTAAESDVDAHLAGREQAAQREAEEAEAERTETDPNATDPETPVGPSAGTDAGGDPGDPAIDDQEPGRPAGTADGAAIEDSVTAPTDDQRPTPADAGPDSGDAIGPTEDAPSVPNQPEPEPEPEPRAVEGARTGGAEAALAGPTAAVAGTEINSTGTGSTGIDSTEIDSTEIDTAEAEGEALGGPAPATETETESATETETDGTGAGPNAPADAAFGDSTPAAGGGDCGPDASGGGAGGGSALAEPPVDAVPDVAGRPPAGAMATVAELGPARMGPALTGVATVATDEVARDHAALESTPPSLERPAGSPQTRPADTAARTAADAPAAAQPAAPAAAPRGAWTPPPTIAPLPAPPPAPTIGIGIPATPGAQETASAAEAQALRDSIRTLPTTDPGLDVTAGPAPTVQLTGDADPGRAAEQRRLLDNASSTAREGGRVDAAAALGEQDIFPDVPPETLTAEAPAGIEPATGEPIVVADQTTAVIADAEFRDDAQAAARTESGRLGTARTAHDTKVADRHAKAREDADREVEQSAAKQESVRAAAQTGIAGQRTQWRSEQDSAVEIANTGADTEQLTANTAVATERDRADRAAAEHIDTGNRAADRHRQDAEGQVRERKARAAEESSGVLSWIGSRVSSFFASLRQAIGNIFAAARRFVREAIATAQRLAGEVIDRARQVIVAAIQAAAAALVLIGDVLLAAFPELRERFRSAISDIVDDAVNAVNQLANALKTAVQLVLNLLAGAIDTYLRALQAVYLAAIDVVAKAVRSALDAAAAIVRTIGQFAELARHIAPDPIGWLRNLGAAAVDGIRNHLWAAMKCAVKEWFNSKVQAVLGLGRAILTMLRRGGIDFAKISRIAFDAIKAALPTMVVSLLIEKLISLLIPAASALMLIIDGLRAAWGAMSRIIAAIDAFMRFLLAVKFGNAGRQFAAALAAGVTAVIDFLANFLLVRLRGAAVGASGRLAGMATRIGRRLGGIGRAAARAARAIGRVGRRAAGAVRRAARRLGTAARGAGRRIAGLARRAGRRLTRLPRVRAAIARGRGLWRSARARVRRWQRDRRRRAAERRRRRQDQARKRLEHVLTDLRPKASQALSKGIGRLAWWGQLRLWQIRYRLRSLTMHGRKLVARVNPPGEVTTVEDVALGATLERILQQAELSFYSKLDQERVDGVGEAVQQAQVPGHAPYRPLDFAQRALFFRQIGGLRQRFRGLLNRFRVIGEDIVAFFAPGTTKSGRAKRDARKAMGGWRIPYPPRPVPGVPVAPERARLQRLTPGSYEDIAEYLVRFGRILRVDPARLVRVANAPSTSAQLAAVQRLVDQRLTQGQPGYNRRAPLLAALTRAIQALGLVRALEAGRMPGQLAAQALSVSAGGSLHEVLLRDPMATFASGTAADAEQRGLRIPPNWSENVEAAQKTRRARITQIFRRIRHRVQSANVFAESRHEREALAAVASAFEDLLQTRTLHEDPQRMELSEQMLMTAVLNFIRTYHGRST